jgi:hypothetical protein
MIEALSGSTPLRSNQQTVFSRVVMMKWFRFSISSLMVVVLVVALDCMAVNLLIVRRLLRIPLSELVLVGALPMANILAIGLLRLWAYRNGRGRTRPLLVGFEVCGWVTLLVFVTCAVLATDSLHDGVGDILRSLSLRPENPLFLIGAVAILLLPQLALASFGGWLIRNYRIEVKIVVHRRAAELPLPGVAVGPTNITSVPPPLAGSS